MLPKPIEFPMPITVHGDTRIDNYFLLAYLSISLAAESPDTPVSEMRLAGRS